MKKKILFLFLGIVLVTVAVVSYSFTVAFNTPEAVVTIDEAAPPCCPKGPWFETTTDNPEYSPFVDLASFDKNEDGTICINGRRLAKFMDNNRNCTPFSSGGD